MSVADWSALVVAVVTVVGAVLAGVAWIVRRALAEADIGHQVVEVRDDLDQHKTEDRAAFASIEQRLDEAGRAMRELTAQQQRTDAKVDVLLQWTGAASPGAASPENRSARIKAGD